MKKLFSKANMILAESQEEYTALEVNYNPVLPEKPMTAQFMFSPEQLEYLQKNKGVFYVTQLTFGNNYAPISIDLDEPATLCELDEKGLQLYNLDLNISQHIQAQVKLSENLERLIAEKEAIENPINDVNVN